MNIYEFLVEKANEELSKLEAKVVDESWFNTLLEKLKEEVTSANLEEEILTASMEAINLLAANKELLVGLGSHAFSLLLCQIACGKNAEAMETYIKALSDPNDLIALMNSGADGVIQAKIKLDKLHNDSQNLVKNLLTLGMRMLIPFILMLI